MTYKITCVVNDIAIRDSDLQSEHGLSFWIEVDGNILLFDTGQTGRVLAHNMSVLGLNPRKVNALALSHAHYDHTGGLGFVLSENKILSLYAHPDIFRPRYSYKNGQYKSIGLTQKLEELSNRGKLVLDSQPVMILPGVWTTGEISERPELQGSSSHHFVRNGEDWQPDSYKDDLSLVMEYHDGLILVCGCCHAGLLNTLFHVKREFRKQIYAVIGGTHLLTADGLTLRHVVDVLDKQFPDMVYFLNHCTGESALRELKDTFGRRVSACPAGTNIDFDNIALG